MAGFEDLGALFAGNSAGNALSYAKGMSLGANTENAVAQARQRVRENTAIERLQNDPALAAQFGLGDATGAVITAAAAGLDPTKFADYRKTSQEIGLRGIASDPNVTPERANIALRGVANAPVERYYSVGTGHADKFNDTGVVATPRAPGAGAGGDAAAIQILRAFGMLDEGGHVPEAQRQKAFDVMRTTGKTVDEGGVPGVIDFNPFAPPRAAAAPPAPATSATPDLGSELAPTFTPPVAGPSAVTPVSPVGRVAANTAAIAKAKEEGKAAGEAAAGLPKAQATSTSQLANADNVMGMIDKALKGVSGSTTGPLGAALGHVPGTNAYDFKKQIQRIQANVGFKELAQMRHESPTGGALGNVTERELSLLQSTMGNLDQAQSPEQFAQMLTDIRDSYARFKDSLARDLAAQKTTAGVNPPAAAAPGAYADPAKEARYQAWKAAQGAR